LNARSLSLYQLNHPNSQNIDITGNYFAFVFLRHLNSENSGARSQKCVGSKMEVYQKLLCGIMAQQHWLRNEWYVTRSYLPSQWKIWLSHRGWYHICGRSVGFIARAQHGKNLKIP
jgi:hypothetical protein